MHVAGGAHTCSAKRTHHRVGGLERLASLAGHELAVDEQPGLDVLQDLILAPGLLSAGMGLKTPVTRPHSSGHARSLMHLCVCPQSPGPAPSSACQTFVESA